MSPPAIVFDSHSASASWSATAASRLNQAVTADRTSFLDAVEQVDRLARSQRMAGFIHYDAGGCFERLPARAVDDLGLPLLGFTACDGVRAERTPAVTNSPSDVSPTSNFTREQYERAVQHCLHYISAGDVFQINLSQRFTAPLEGEPWSLYTRLQKRFPAEYGAFLDFGNYQFLSNSPELFLRVTKLPGGRRKIVNRPIKGTRPNAPNMFYDLQDSGKDRAELAMIVDLQRNDLGRICEIGSVKVTHPRSIETYPTVLHGVATIEGILRQGVSLTEILRATFPCGSVTGCPKIRAMEIIDELEPVRRGVYCGAIGWIEGDDMELAVAIRTMTIKDGRVHIPVGGGIVADSAPAEEYEETLVKARAMFAALRPTD